MQRLSTERSVITNSLSSSLNSFLIIRKQYCWLSRLIHQHCLTDSRPFFSLISNYNRTSNPRGGLPRVLCMHSITREVEDPAFEVYLRQCVYSSTRGRIEGVYA